MATILGDTIRAARTAKGLTQAQVGKALGVTRAAVYNWESGGNIPATEHLLAICDLLGLSLSTASGGLTKVTPLSQSPLIPNEAPIASSAPPMVTAPSATARLAEAEFTRQNMPDDVPVYGVAVGGNDGFFFMNGEIVDRVRRPPGVANARKVYGIYVIGESMLPRYEPGELLYVNPDRPASIGDYVVVQLQPAEDGSPGRAYIKRLCKRTPRSIVVEQFNPPETIEISSVAILAVHRVMPWKELLGI